MGKIIFLFLYLVQSGFLQLYITLNYAEYTEVEFRSKILRSNLYIYTTKASQLNKCA